MKPVYNDDFYNKMYHLWFIQQCVLMKADGTNLLLLTFSAFWNNQDGLQKAEKYPLGGRYGLVSLYTGLSHDITLFKTWLNV